MTVTGPFGENPGVMDAPAALAATSVRDPDIGHQATVDAIVGKPGYVFAASTMKQLTNGAVTLLGNIPPRDVLAQGTPADVAASVKTALESVEDRSRIVLSCGGGVPSDVSTENLQAFIQAVS